MKTIAELENYLEKECYSFRELSVGRHQAPEGMIIEKLNGCYHFAYSERGHKRVIQSFPSEQELVEFALQRLKNDKWSKAHLAAWVWNEAEIRNAQQELKSMDIAFERNDIPNYSMGKRAYRIFVFGRDVLRLDDFQKRYYKP